MQVEVAVQALVARLQSLPSGRGFWDEGARHPRLWRGDRGGGSDVERETIEPNLYLEHTGGMIGPGVAGWLVATFGPLAPSIGTRLAARGLKARRLLHATFIPLAILVYDAGASRSFYAADVPDGDSIEGYSLVAATGFLLVTLIAHPIAFVSEAYRVVGLRAKER